MTIKEKAYPYLKQVTKPGRYTGGEYGEILKDKRAVKTRIAFCFPDSYEIGMSNLGMKILYAALNREETFWCERCFAPWPDMAEVMKANNLPLYALESGDALLDFDCICFTLQYEMSYTNVLYMLDLAGIPLYASDRDSSYPLVIGGGPCAYNPEPVADFFDAFSIGEGEESLPAFIRAYETFHSGKQDRMDKKAFLVQASHMDGIYVPSLYDVTVRKDGGIQSIDPFPAASAQSGGHAPERILKSVVSDFDAVYFPKTTPVPFLETVHDRIMLEAARGCIRGCRFCQAGMIYRPYRPKTPETIDREARAMADSTGYEEVSLTSLSISDLPRLSELVDTLTAWTSCRKIGLSLPSMRVDSFEQEIMEKVEGVRKSGVTFAPEAGTQRMRDCINKNITEDEILDACRMAFSSGRTNIKLYFMLGLPTETDDDIRGIAELAQKIVDLYYQNPNRKKGKSAEVTISVSCFVPKADTPFQWFGQDSLEELIRKQKLLRDCITSKKIRYHWHEAKVSVLEAAFARGDRRLSAVLYEAFQRGAKFDAWDEFFDDSLWQSAFAAAGLAVEAYAERTFSFDELLPWDHIDCGVTKEFLAREAKRALDGKTTPDCARQCSHCGAARFGSSLCQRTLAFTHASLCAGDAEPKGEGAQ